MESGEREYRKIQPQQAGYLYLAVMTGRLDGQLALRQVCVRSINHTKHQRLKLPMSDAPTSSHHHYRYQVVQLRSHSH